MQNPIIMSINVVCRVMLERSRRRQQAQQTIYAPL